MSGILSIGTSALLAFQNSLSTVSHNIANVNTEGYSRQRTEMSSRIPQASGNGFIGTGVQVVGVERQVDSFLTTQLRTNLSSHAQSDTYAQLAGNVDSMLADPNIGLMPTLQGFFNAVDDVANDPASIPARQQLLSESESLADRFQFFHSRFEELNQAAHSQVESTVLEINQIADAIANLNKDIVVAQGVGGGQAPNDLLDQRDLLVNNLSELVSAKVVEQDDGQLNVFIGTGQTLVLGQNANSLEVAQDQFDPEDFDILLVSSNSKTIVSDLITGGQLGGVMAFRTEILKPAMNELGRIAITLSETFNAQHQLGQDLTGQLGGNFFGQINGTAGGRGPQFFGAQNNNPATDVLATVDITDVNELTTSDYRLIYNAGNFSLMRMSDQSTLGTFSAAGLPPGPLTLDFAQPGVDQGFEITLTGTSITDGDEFLIKPTFNGADDIAVSLTNVNSIAMASPIQASARVDAVTGMPNNLGDGVISDEVVTSRVAGSTAPWPDYNITFNGNQVSITSTTSGGALTLTPAGAGNYNPATDGSGKQFTLTDSTFGTITFTMAGVPQDTDGFSITNNTQGAGDNRNALALSQLRTTKLMDNGSSTYQNAYSQLVTSVGTKTHSAQISKEAQFNLLEQVKVAHQSVSGVNLDEEAANLIQLQQAYQAAAQLIATGQTLFDTLMSTLRR